MKRFFLLLALLAQCIFAYAQTERSKGLSIGGESLKTSSRKVDPYASPMRKCHLVTIGYGGPYSVSPLNRLSYTKGNCDQLESSINKLFPFEYSIQRHNLKEDRCSYDEAYALLENVSSLSVASGDLVILYFSGHGITKKGTYFFALRNSNLDTMNDFLRGDYIVSVANKLANKGCGVLVFLDTCEAGSIVNEGVSVTNPYGYVAIFPASGENQNTSEVVRYGGSKYFKALKEVLAGENITDNLTVGTIGSVLKNEALNQAPVYHAHSNYSVANRIILSHCAYKIDYIEKRDVYLEFYNKGAQCIEDKKYNEALIQLQSAYELHNEINYRDTIPITATIDKLNKAIASEVNAMNDSYLKYNQHTSSIYEDLCKIDVNNHILDKNMVNYGDLFRNCGFFYCLRSDLPDAGEYAYPLFNKAIKYGDKDATALMLGLNPNKLPAKYRLNDNQRNELYSKCHHVAGKLTNDEGQPLDVFVYSFSATITDTTNTPFMLIADRVFCDITRADINTGEYSIAASPNGELMFLWAQNGEPQAFSCNIEGKSTINQSLHSQGYNNSHHVTGRVYDSKGKPIIGAGVIVPNTSIGTITGLDGEYTIKTPTNSKLEFSALGYKSTRVSIDGRNKIDITLEKNSVFSDVIDAIEDSFYDEPLLGGAVSSDFTSTGFPYGLQLSAYWGCFSLGLEGVCRFRPIIIGANLLPTIDSKYVLTNTEWGEKQSIYFVGLRPGLFYKYVSLDCGLGILGEMQDRKDFYSYTTSSPSTNSDNGIGTHRVTTYTYNHFYCAPGITGVIPIVDDYMYLTASCHYRICPKAPTYNGFEAAIGVAFLLEY